MSISSELGNSHTVVLRDGEISYRERGEGPTLVFIHGPLVNGDLWRKVVSDLARDCRCITPDWPLGAHRSPMRPQADLTPTGLALIIEEFLEKLELDDVTLVSNDTATALTQLVLAKSPRRVRRAVMTSGTPSRTSLPVHTAP